MILDNGNITYDHISKRGLHLTGRGTGRIAMNILFLIFFSLDFFSRKTKLQSRGLTEKLSQIHGNSRNLQHKFFNLIYFKRNKRYKLIQNTQYINKGRKGGGGGGGEKLDAKFNSRNEGYPIYM